jgi:hypothetical protein
MAPPHERCGEFATAGMLRTGFEALMIDRANPWRFRPPEERATAGWELAEMVSGGLPVLRRESVACDDDDLILRAFLRQPLILYLHQKDLKDGYETVATAAARIGRLGRVRWCSPREIVQTNYLRRLAGSTLHVRALSGRIALEMPPGADRVQIHVPRAQGMEGCEVSNGSVASELVDRGGTFDSQPLEARGTTTVEIVGPGVERPQTRPSVRTSTAIARRTIAELRDRLQPVGLGRRP